MHLTISHIFRVSGTSEDSSTSQHSPGITNTNITIEMSQTQGSVPRATATVHPYSVDTRQLNVSFFQHVQSLFLGDVLLCDAINIVTSFQTRQPMYNQGLYNPYPQYTAAKPSQATIATNDYRVHPDIQFKRLPFFDTIADLIAPSSLMPQTNHRIQEGVFYFHLTPVQATEVAISRDIRHGTKCEYSVQVQMRFCQLETTCEQEDFFPPNVVVKVNNKLCPLPVCPKIFHVFKWKSVCDCTESDSHQQAWSRSETPAATCKHNSHGQVESDAFQHSSSFVGCRLRTWICHYRQFGAQEDFFRFVAET